MTSLYDLQEVLHGVLRPAAGAASDPHQVLLGPIALDSRKVAAGDVFWALDGPRHDGAEFVADALARGAAGAVVARPVEAAEDRWILVVHDTQQALEQWAAWSRARFTGTVIAVTGSVGKATCRQMIHTVLGKRLAGTAGPRNFNNHVGLPMSLLGIRPEHDYALLELGASRVGEIAALAALAAPAIGVVTQLGDSTLTSFGTQRATAEAYAELLSALPSDGHAVLGDDAWLRKAARQSSVPVTWVGRAAHCDVSATDVRCGHGRLEFRVAGCEFTVPVWGRKHLLSALSAVAVGRLMGFDLDEMAQRLRGFEPLPGRCEVTEVREATIIHDTRGTDPASMHSALEILRDFDAEGRRIVVAGDMPELGEESVMEHRRLGIQMGTLGGADLLIACGQFARDLVAGARAAGMPPTHSLPCRTLIEALPFLGQAITPGDVVLVLGSGIEAVQPMIEAMRQYPRRRIA